MGGMNTIKMAEILESDGEDVLGGHADRQHKPGGIPRFR